MRPFSFSRRRHELQFQWPDAFRCLFVGVTGSILDFLTADRALVLLIFYIQSRYKAVATE